jgi:predicted kinase
MEVIICKGLPASGKSTWAKATLAENPGKYKRINKDDLRSMLDDGKFSKGNEAFVLTMRDQAIRAALDAGRSVIVDDTNFAPKHEEQIRQLAGEFGASVSVRTFDVPVDECIRRDLKRPQSVGADVIRKMWRQYIAPQPSAPEVIDGVPLAIIVDLDGTLALIGDRSPYDASRCGEDALSPVVSTIVRLCRDSGGVDPRHVLLMSGRQELHRPETERWLAIHDIGYDALWMRATGDTRRDSIVKRELFDEHVAGRYNIEFVLDDRNQVVEMWRNELGLACLQVAEGDF